MDTKLTADGLGITIWWALPNTFADPRNPTAVEINSGAINVTKSTSWENWGFGAQASTQNSDPAIGDVGNVQFRGFAQFGGTISFFYPNNYTDLSNEHLVTFEAVRDPRTLGYILIRVDGAKTTAGTDDSDKPAVDGDFLRIYRVLSDGWADVNTGETSFKYTITFQPQGELYMNAVVGTHTISTPAPIGATDYSVGGKTPLSAYVTGRQLASDTGIWSGYPGWFQWTSSDPTIATVDANGVVTGVSAGEVDITATHKTTRIASTALSVTIA